MGFQVGPVELPAKTALLSICTRAAFRAVAPSGGADPSWTCRKMRLLSIFTDVVDCFLRHLNAVLVEAGVCPEETFWQTVAESAAGYLDRVPHLAERARRYDLFAPEFALSCLNRLQLRDNQQMVDLADPAGALQLVGTLANPFAPYRPGT